MTSRIIDIKGLNWERLAACNKQRYGSDYIDWVKKQVQKPVSHAVNNTCMDDQEHINNCLSFVPSKHKQQVIERYNRLFEGSRRDANLYLIACKDRAEKLRYGGESCT